MVEAAGIEPALKPRNTLNHLRFALRKIESAVSPGHQEKPRLPL